MVDAGRTQHRRNYFELSARNLDRPRRLPATAVAGHQMIGQHQVAYLEVVCQRTRNASQDYEVNVVNLAENARCVFGRPSHPDAARGERDLRIADTPVAAFEPIDA